jgi:hypothetical protein
MKTRYYQSPEGFIYSWTGYDAPSMPNLKRLHHAVDCIWLSVATFPKCDVGH